MKRVLITGGTGFIGQAIIKKLSEKGYSINVLSRKKEYIESAEVYWWDPSNNFIDEKALEGVTDIIHLAGANILDKTWNKHNKARLIKSRTHSIELLYKTVKEANITLNSFTSASAIGYYGAVTTEDFFNEETTPQNNDFAAILCEKWEEKATIFSEITRVNKVRIGLVVGENCPIIERMKAQPILSPLGKGSQWFPWVSVDDVARIFIHLLENPQIEGVFNATSPNPVTNSEFTNLIAKNIGKIVLPVAPAFLLRLILGDRAELLLNGTRISSKKITTTGFSFNDINLETTLKKYSKIL